MPDTTRLNNLYDKLSNMRLQHKDKHIIIEDITECINIIESMDLYSAYYDMASNATEYTEDTPCDH